MGQIQIYTKQELEDRLVETGQGTDKRIVFLSSITIRNCKLFLRTKSRCRRTYGCAFLLRSTKYATANKQAIAKTASKPGGLGVTVDVAVGAEEVFEIGDGCTFTGDAVAGSTDGFIVDVAVGITDSVSVGVIATPSSSLSSVGATVRDGEPVDDGVCVKLVTIVNVPFVAGAVSKPTFSPLRSDNCRLFKHISVVSPGSPTTRNLSSAMMPLVPFGIASTSLPVYAIETLVPHSKLQ